MTLSIGEPKRNKDYQKAHFPKRTTDDTESQAMARFAVVEQPDATPAPSAPMILLREVAGRLQGSGQADDPGHQPTPQPPGPRLPRARHPRPTTSPPAGCCDCSTSIPPPNASPRPTSPPWRRSRISPASKPRRCTRPLGNRWRRCRGDVAEALVRDLVTQVRHCQKAERDLRTVVDRRLCRPARLAPRPGRHHPRHRRGHRRRPGRQDRGHRPLRDARPASSAISASFPRRTAPASTSRATPCPRARCTCRRKGNDLVRAYLWNAARTAIRHNPAVRALYRRLRAKGKRGDVAIGHCMRKLLHLVFAVWKTDRPFDAKHFPWENPGDTPVVNDDSRRSQRRCNVRCQRRSRGPQTGHAREESGHHGQFHRRAGGLSCQAGDAAAHDHAAQGGLSHSCANR